jgi:hypothetical protein
VIFCESVSLVGIISTVKDAGYAFSGGPCPAPFIGVLGDYALETFPSLAPVGKYSKLKMQN